MILSILFIVLLIFGFVAGHLTVYKYQDYGNYIEFMWKAFNSFPLKQINDTWYKLRYGIENVIDWFPIIWKDRDWDEHYLFVVMNKKFERMERLHRENGHLVRASRTAKQLMVVKNLTKRIMEHPYLTNAMYEYDKKYDDALDFESMFEPIEGRKGWHVMVDRRSEKQQAEYRRAGDHADKMEKQDLDMLFDLLKKQINKWWD